MKKLNIFLLSLIAVTVFVACGTREDELSNEQFVGTWNWAATTGGIGNINDTPASTGIQRTITFTDTYIYTVKENDASGNLDMTAEFTVYSLKDALGKMNTGAAGEKTGLNRVKERDAANMAAIDEAKK